MKFGGDPIVLQTMIQVQHAMAVTGQTMFVNVWKCVADGGMSVPFGADEHSFEMTFKAQRQATGWASSLLNSLDRLRRPSRVVPNLWVQHSRIRLTYPGMAGTRSS